MNQKLLWITNLPVVTLNTLEEGYFCDSHPQRFPGGNVLGDKVDEDSMQGLHVAPGEDVVHD